MRESPEEPRGLSLPLRLARIRAVPGSVARTGVYERTWHELEILRLLAREEREISEEDLIDSVDPIDNGVNPVNEVPLAAGLF